MASKLKKGDQVIAIAGKDKGRQGTITKVLPNKGRVYVEGINMVKKHVRPNPNVQEPGGIKDVEAPIQLSNVAIFNTATGKADRVGFKVLEDGRKVRVFKSNGEQIDI
jgi:large subunit ribosomal protein L24